MTLDNSPPPRRYSLEETFAKAQLSTPEARQACFEKYAPAILRAVRGKMDAKVRSACDSEDFMQRAQLKVLRFNFEGKDFETVRAFVTYVIKLAEREVQQERRNIFRQADAGEKGQKSLETLSASEAQQLVDAGAAPGETAATEERRRRVLAQLPFMYQRVAVRIREGCKHKEIAAQLGICERTVGTAVQTMRAVWLAEEEKGN